MGPSYAHGGPYDCQDNSASEARRQGRPGKDIVAESNDIMELQCDVLLVRDAHVIHKCLRRKQVAGPGQQQVGSPPSMLLWARHCPSDTRAPSLTPCRDHRTDGR